MKEDFGTPLSDRGVSNQTHFEGTDVSERQRCWAMMALGVSHNVIEMLTHLLTHTHSGALTPHPFKAKSPFAGAYQYNLTQ